MKALRILGILVSMAGLLYCLLTAFRSPEFVLGALSRPASAWSVL